MAIDLFAWLSERPLWQQEAARLICENGTISQAEIEKLAPWIEKGAPSDAQPLQSHHIADHSQDASLTLLAAIGPVENIDRLASHQPPLKFAANGITLIYGHNGSGKSGYCRIAKALCHCVHRAELLSDIYADGAGPKAVSVAYQVGSTLEQIVWRDDQPAPAALSRIAVFDAHAARIYVDGDRRISFLPTELHIVTQLGLAVHATDQRYREDERRLAALIKTPLPAGYHPGSEASSLMSRLTATVRRLDLPAEAALRAAATWSEEDEAALKSLEIELAKTPEQRVRDLRSKVTSLESIRERMSQIELAIGASAVIELQHLKADAAAKRELAAVDAGKLFKDEPIPNVGSDAWRLMLRYARDYAAETFKKDRDKAVSEADLCVLCHQGLDTEAHHRLHRFESYLDDRKSEDAEAARTTFQARAGSVLDLAVPDEKTIDVALSLFLDRDDLQIAKEIQRFFQSARQRHARLAEIIKSNGYDSISDLHVLATQPDISPFIEMFLKEAEQLSSSQVDDYGPKRTKLANLRDRKKLNNEIEIAVLRRNHLDEFLKVGEHRALCATGPITTFLGRLRREVLTPSLADRLESELKKFRLSHLPIKLRDRGETGDSKIEVSLDTRSKQQKSNILSEGEQRALALACFLAELGEVGSKHGIVVDDPVSSLDHARMDEVARRLVEESQSRQVIIFTHSLPFHYAICSAATFAQTPLHREFIASRDELFGIIDPDNEPWLMKSVRTRLPMIDAAIRRLRETYKPTDETHRPRVREIYAMMRETWERVVEEVLFANVVGRFRPEVQTLRLRAAQVDDQDRAAVFAGMSRCSTYSGHDHSTESPPQLPLIEVIEADLGILRTYYESAQARKKKLESAGLAAMEPPPGKVLV